MPQAWSFKDEQMFEHIKQSERDRGRELERAREIAARTVNKQRRQEGRTASRIAQGAGNPRRELEFRTKEELYNIAREKNISGRSNMDKQELIEAIRARA